VEPLLHVVTSNRLLITAFSDHGKIMKVFHQTRVTLEREHHPGPLALTIGHIPPSKGTRFCGSFCKHAHCIAYPFTFCRGSLPTAHGQIGGSLTLLSASGRACRNSGRVANVVRYRTPWLLFSHPRASPIEWRRSVPGRQRRRLPQSC